MSVHRTVRSEHDKCQQQQQHDGNEEGHDEDEDSMVISRKEGACDGDNHMRMTMMQVRERKRMNQR